MNRTYSSAAVFLFLAMFGIAACTNQNGAGGTVDGTDENNYELNHGHLAPAMDSVKADAQATGATTVPVAVDTTAAKAAK